MLKVKKKEKKKERILSKAFFFSFFFLDIQQWPKVMSGLGELTPSLFFILILKKC